MDYVLPDSDLTFTLLWNQICYGVI